MNVFLGFFLYIFYIIYFVIITFSFFTVFFTCNSAFEQGHLEPWRYINAFIIIIINNNNAMSILIIKQCLSLQQDDKERRVLLGMYLPQCGSRCHTSNYALHLCFQFTHTLAGTHTRTIADTYLVCGLWRNKLSTIFRMPILR